MAVKLAGRADLLEDPGAHDRTSAALLGGSRAKIVAPQGGNAVQNEPDESKPGA